MALETIHICPICGGNNFEEFMLCTDYTTTKEKFQLQKCTRCTFVFTSPRPDESAIGKYYESKSYISHTGQSSELFDSLYLFARSFTLKWKTNLIRKIKTPTTILDYGCGTGGFLNVCADLGWKSYGVEPSANAHAKASSRSDLTIAKTLTEISDQKFDAITLWHVLEHVADLKEKLYELKNRLTENGTLFVAVPNYASHDGQVYKMHWAGYDVPRHLWHFTQDTMKKLAESAGLTLVDIKPMKLDAYYVSLLSEKYKNGAHTLGGITSAILTAITSNRKAKQAMNYSSLIYILK